METTERGHMVQVPPSEGMKCQVHISAINPLQLHKIKWK